ncbi:protein of unknown function [Xenorhabdus doucetiae]|uniref:Uncharacterized protein n=1 Tax=Xenorhabdus doucetiae TaxID=351671 RepID=A0A068QUU9_9GAMM|nr:protein of unknown function [Xenorhabdus doucetiae]
MPCSETLKELPNQLDKAGHDARNVPAQAVNKNEHPTKLPTAITLFCLEPKLNAKNLSITVFLPLTL